MKSMVFILKVGKGVIHFFRDIELYVQLGVRDVTLYVEYQRSMIGGVSRDNERFWVFG